jgi:hypothetical protein
MCGCCFVQNLRREEGRSTASAANDNLEFGHALRRLRRVERRCIG